MIKRILEGFLIRIRWLIYVENHFPIEGLQALILSNVSKIEEKILAILTNFCLWAEDFGIVNNVVSVFFSCRVSIKLGDSNDKWSKDIKLTKFGKNTFERGCTDSFNVLKTDIVDLNASELDINKIQIWRNNFGINASWYVQFEMLFYMNNKDWDSYYKLNLITFRATLFDVHFIMHSAFHVV